MGLTARFEKVTDMQYQHIGHRIKGFYMSLFNLKDRGS